MIKQPVKDKAPTPLPRAEFLRLFEEDSIVCVGRLFSDEEIQSYQYAFDHIRTDPGPAVVIHESNSERVRSIMQWENASSKLSQFARDQRVLDYVSLLLGDAFVFHQTKYNPKAPRKDGGEKWDPHRGITFWNHLDGVQDPAGIVSVFIAMTEQTVQNGAAVTWKGAHKLSMQEIKQETSFADRMDVSGDTAASLSLQIKPENMVQYNAAFEKIPLVGPAGTVWIMDSRNLHSSQENNSHKTRTLIANVFRSISNTPQHPRKNSFLCGDATTPLMSYSKAW